MVGVNKCHRLMPTDMSHLVVTRVKLEVFTWNIYKHIINTTKNTVINKNRQVIKTWKIYPICYKTYLEISKNKSVKNKKQRPCL